MVLNTFIYFESLILIYLDPLGTSIVVFVLDNRKLFGKKRDHSLPTQTYRDFISHFVLLWWINTLHKFFPSTSSLVTWVLVEGTSQEKCPNIVLHLLCWKITQTSIARSVSQVYLASLAVAILKALCFKKDAEALCSYLTILTLIPASRASG